MVPEPGRYKKEKNQSILKTNSFRLKEIHSFSKQTRLWTTVFLLACREISPTMILVQFRPVPTSRIIMFLNQIQRGELR